MHKHFNDRLLHVLEEPNFAGRSYRPIYEDYVAISAIGKRYTASRLITCSALIITDGKRQLFAHVLVATDMGKLKEVIERNFDLSSGDICVTIVPGNTDRCKEGCTSDYTRQGIENILTELQLKNPATYLFYKNTEHHVVQEVDGSVSIKSKEDFRAYIEGVESSPDFPKWCENLRLKHLERSGMYKPNQNFCRGGFASFFHKLIGS